MPTAAYHHGADLYHLDQARPGVGAPNAAGGMYHSVPQLQAEMGGTRRAIHLRQEEAYELSRRLRQLQHEEADLHLRCAEIQRQMLHASLDATVPYTYRPYPSVGQCNASCRVVESAQVQRLKLLHEAPGFNLWFQSLVLTRSLHPYPLEGTGGYGAPAYAPGPPVRRCRLNTSG